ncbi:F-box/kelch-repeat protein At3g23880-like [Chenopodium quinoa]|uniref:F-box/kelch-repeat protein At3g23880-like n=1 Tax=Chenopodium quinoa TaxID=63459 RepID=UPI000B77F693|nr:F-box/kelch-repeat protein At3g23880-like [Chenopodium quinoa]XP_021718982.1 F-box/kelch-repeat protein At3g23880-like [Chenopodium quinoa]
MWGRKRQKPLQEHHYLTPDLWREVFARSPVKTLLQFRCVCKTWCSLIDSPDFISMHLKFYKNPRILAVEPIPKTFSDFKFIIRRSDSIRKIAQLDTNLESRMNFESVMVDGLMLIGRFTFHDSDSKELSLWNPSIRKTMLLPHCPLKCIKFSNVGYYLGFAPLSKDYKVVALEAVELGDAEASELSIEIAIYSLSGRVWRVKPDWRNVTRWCFSLMRLRNGAVFSQGALYWRPYYGFPGKDTHLLSFDLDTEEFSFLKMPDFGEEMRKFLFLFGGSLAVFGISRVRACVWVIEKNHGKEPWCQFSSGDSNLDAYRFFDCCSMHNLHMLYVENTGTLLIHDFNKLMSYDITSHQVQQRKYFRCSYLDTYVESLVLHKGC